MKVSMTDAYNFLIIDTIKEMIRLAKKGNFTAKQILNGVTVLVNGDSDADLIFRDLQRAYSGYIRRHVGPYPKAELTAEDKASDARVEAKNELKRQKWQVEYDKNARAHREKVEAKLANAPAIDLTDEAGWQKFMAVNTGGYRGAVVTYSERWARLMQVEMANGKKLEDVADAASEEADLEGITGFMYGFAVSVLEAYWKHGVQLRQWHNLKTQIGY